MLVLSSNSPGPQPVGWYCVNLGYFFPLQSTQETPSQTNPQVYLPGNLNLTKLTTKFNYHIQVNSPRHGSRLKIQPPGKLSNEADVELLGRMGTCSYYLPPGHVRKSQRALGWGCLGQVVA